MVNGITFISPTSVTLNVNTTGATPGAKNVTITNPDGQSVTGAGILAVTPVIPVITSPTNASATEGQSFAYQIAATNNPTSYAAIGLPPGLNSPTSTGLILGVPTARGKFPVTLKATNPSGTGEATLNLTVCPSSVSLTDALDGPGLVWTTGGNAPWCGETTVTHDGVDAATSGLIGGGQESWMETSVVGAGTLSFWWKVSSQPNLDFLRLFLDGNPKDVASIQGEVDWQRVTLPIAGAGTHMLRWSYKKALHNAAGFDSGWVDEVSFTSVSPGDVAFVDSSNLLDQNQDGSLAHPYSRFVDGYTHAAVGGTLNIRKGTYAVDVPMNRLDKRLKLVPRDGRVLLAARSAGGATEGGSNRRIVFTGELPSGGFLPMLDASTFLAGGSFELLFDGVPGLHYQVLTSTDLQTWDLWQDFVPEDANFSIIDPEAVDFLQRFYKLVLP